ncbi:MAG TPA: MmcQ/YjbR family DNA-binding protein [Bryobacteraceae bacterium]|nr:MmcQ/YjbR family DNA-binding protein [Bryobacteraceae bacterium]
MARQGINFETVRTIAMALPGVEEGAAYGSPALRVRGKLLACIPAHKSAEPNSLAVWVDIEQRTELLETDPETYYVKDHYLNYPVVLVRLAHIRADALEDLLGMAWRYVTTRRAAPRAKKTRGRARRQ